MEHEPFVAEARTYIVKGCRPTVHRQGEQVEVVPTGLKNNRRFMVTEWDEELNMQRCVSQRAQHKGERLALVTPTMNETCLFLNAEGMPECRIPLGKGKQRIVASVQNDIVTVREQPEGSKWMSDFLRRHCLLVEQAEPRRVDHQAVPSHIEVSLADRHPILAIGRATLERVRELVRKKNNRDVTVEELTDAFRPNLVLGGIDVKEEHDIDSGIVGGGNVLLQRSVQCVRCDVPDVDQRTGKRRTGIVAAIAKEFHNGKDVLLGEQFHPVTTGWFTVGDRLRHVIWKQGGFDRPVIPRNPQ